MKKKVILTLAGSYEQGMSANLRILEEMGASERETLRVFGQLPPTKNLIQVFQKWQISYRRQINSALRMKFIDAQVTQVSCQELSTQLCFEFNKWLNSKYEKWQKIRDKLQQNLSKTDEILLIIETEDRQVQQLPWQLWKLITDDYPYAEVALSVPDYQTLQLSSSSTNLVKILAVLGNNEGINVGADRAFLESLPDTKVSFLVEPKRRELTKQLWNEKWDILFFAGHSGSKEDGSTGIISINRNDSLTISDFKYALVKARDNGLKLAIFNSCDGLGIARDLADLNIPQMIVMREPVPDLVAQEFLKNFLTTYAAGESFYLSVRKAREKLQGLESEFPCASWLPVIFQNPVESPPIWKKLSNPPQKQHLSLINKHSLLPVLVISIGITALFAGLRYLGVLQLSELRAFDYLIQLRPNEEPDGRLVIVEVTENDLKLPQQQRRKGSLSDLALYQLLKKLKQYKPRVIGLDIYRDFAVQPELKKLATELQQNERLIAICKGSDESIDDPGVASPPEVPKEQLGFSDFITDPDGVLRRYLLVTGVEPTSRCITNYAFSIQVAFRYLAAEGILPKYTKDGNLQFNDVVLERFPRRSGGYQKTDVLGYQVMLNYRSPGEPENIAPLVTLSQILNGHVNADAFKDKVVIIGTTANSYGDYWLTPYSSKEEFGRRLSGVIAQAQMTSQILSAVLDKRPLLWVTPVWIDIIWIFGCSLVGGVLAIQLKSPISLWLAIAGGEVCLCALSFVLLLHSGYWVALLPSGLALLVTSGSVASYTSFIVKLQLPNQLDELD